MTNTQNETFFLHFEYILAMWFVLQMLDTIIATLSLIKALCVWTRFLIINEVYSYAVAIIDDELQETPNQDITLLPIDRPKSIKSPSDMEKRPITWDDVINDTSNQLFLAIKSDIVKNANAQVSELKDTSVQNAMNDVQHKVPPHLDINSDSDPIFIEYYEPKLLQTPSNYYKKALPSYLSIDELNKDIMIKEIETCEIPNLASMRAIISKYLDAKRRKSYRDELLNGIEKVEVKPLSKQIRRRTYRLEL